MSFLRNVGFLQHFPVDLLLGPSALWDFSSAVCAVVTRVSQLCCVRARGKHCNLRCFHAFLPRQPLLSFLEACISESAFARTFTVFVGRVLGMVAKGWTLVTDFFFHILVQYVVQRGEKAVNTSVLGMHAKRNDVLIPTPPPRKVAETRYGYTNK